MTIHKFVPLAILFLLSCFLQLPAQLTTNTAVLQRASLAARQEEEIAFSRLMALAKQKSWPMVLALKNGRQGYLAGIDPHGYPLYKITNDNIISAATIRTSQLWP